MNMALVSLVSLERTVREAQYPDSPILFRQYLDLVNLELQAQQSELEQTQLLLRCTKALIDTGVDMSVPEHWRRCALDHVCYPLVKLEKVAKSSANQILCASLKNEFRNIKLQFNES